MPTNSRSWVPVRSVLEASCIGEIISLDLIDHIRRIRKEFFCSISCLIESNARAHDALGDSNGDCSVEESGIGS